MTTIDQLSTSACPTETYGAARWESSEESTSGVRSKGLTARRSESRDPDAHLRAFLFATSSVGATISARHIVALRDIAPMFQSETFGSRLQNVRMLVDLEQNRQGHRRATLLRKKHFGEISESEAEELEVLQDLERQELRAELAPDIDYLQQLLGCQP